MNQSIFIAIASYLDYEIKYTILDCIKKSNNPDNLYFSICLQYDEKIGTSEGCIDDLVEDYNITINKFHYSESKGGCWARNIAQKNYNNQTYSLQVDSHTRFIQDWDKIVISDYSNLKEKGIKKPLLSFLPPAYTRDDKLNKDLEFKEKQNLSILQIPKIKFISKDFWPDYGGYNNQIDIKYKPTSITLLYGGFIFTAGEWVQEVEQDPLHYYTGEEFALAIRSYTFGYDFFTPSQIIAWHRAHPQVPKKHFNNNEKIIADKYHTAAMERLRKLIMGNDLGKYGVGNIRTLQEYETFANIDIKNQIVKYV